MWIRGQKSYRNHGTLPHSLKSGLAVEDSWGNIIRSNTVNKNKAYGIFINNSVNNTPMLINGSNNGKYGLFISTPNQGNEIENNRLSSNIR